MSAAHANMAQAGSPPAWARQIDESLTKNNQAPSDRYVQLATVAEGGEPRVRTVVFRGWASPPLAGAPHALSFITDSRSEKMRESDAAEVCWYLAENREQFRVRGVLSKVGHAEDDPVLRKLRADMWQSLSGGARQSFAWPSPGFPRPPDADNQADFQAPEVSATEPSEPFTLVYLLPSRVERLTLRGFPQTRTVWERSDPEGEWTQQALNP